MEVLAPILHPKSVPSGKGAAKRGRAALDMSRSDLESLVAGRPVWMDLGCGDGRFVYRLARNEPQWLVVGIDAAREPMAKIASRAVRPSRKHGAPNLVLAVGAVETLPPELFGLASQVTILFPWGSLLRAVVLGDLAVLEGIRHLAAGPGTKVDVLLNDSLYEQTHVYEKLGLVRLTENHVEGVLAPGFEAAGMARAGGGDWLGQVPNRSLPYETTWGKRLADSHPDGISWYLRFEVE